MAATTPSGSTTSPPAERDALMMRLRRAEGQLRGIQRMLDEGSECRDVLTQLAAVKAAIDQVGLQIITDRLRSCVAGGEADCAEEFEQAMATFQRFATLAR